MATIKVIGDVTSSDPGIQNSSSYEGIIDSAEVQPGQNLVMIVTSSWWRSEVGRRFGKLTLIEVREDGVLFQYGINEVFAEYGKFKFIDKIGLSYSYGSLYVKVSE